MNAMKLIIIMIVLGTIQLFSQFPGTALEFDGVDEYVNCGNDASLNITNSITIEAWINANSWTAEFWGGSIVGKDNTDHTGYNLRCGENGRLSFVNGIVGAWPEAVSSQIMSTNEWYHVAGVYDDISQKIYINGELVGENPTTGPIGVNTNNLQIGDSQGYPGRLFDGKIDEVRIWNVARTETEINDNMYNSLSGTEPGLVAYYELDEGTGTTAGDSAGSNDGTLTNMEEGDWGNSTISPPSVVLLPDPTTLTLVTKIFSSIEKGSEYKPTFIDIDSDGLLDLLIGEAAGNINHYEQDAANSTSFILVTESFNSIYIENGRTAPTFTDLDGDGLLDLIVGLVYDNMCHYEQDSANSMDFSLVTDNFNSIDVGNGEKPTFTDLDGDGLLDMLIGEWDGNINHYEQNAVNSTSFTLVTETFSSINVGSSMSVPTFTDFDGDGLLDLIVGESAGNINHYVQNGINSTSFTLVTENFNGILESRAKPTFTDLDGDGLLDMLVGESYDNISHYEQDSVSEMDFSNILISDYSVKNYVAKASNLSNNLNISCTGEGYSVSLSESSGYTQSLSITPINGLVSNSIFVRFEPTVKQEYIGDISHTSTNMETKYIALSGVGAVIDSIPGTTLEFDGSDDYVETTLSDLSGSAITIEYWFKGSDIQSAVRQQNGNFIVSGWGDKHIISTDGGTTGGVAIGAGAEDGNWHHIAMTWQQNTINGFKSYLDGNLIEQKNSNDTPLPNIDANIIFGSMDGTTEFTNGSLDEVRIWNVARTVSEIRENINLPLTGLETGLVSYWQFNEGSGITTSNIGYIGTLTNMEEADWVNSTIPFGSGTVNTQIVSATGLVDFTGTDLTMDFTEKTGIDTIVVTKIDLAPNTIPSDVDVAFDSQYWVVRKYGTGTYNSNTTFNISEDLTIEDESSPNNICLHTRNIGANDNWYVETRSDSVNSDNEQATFDLVNYAGQYILTKSGNPFIKSLYPLDNQIAVLLNENLTIKFDMTILAGVGNIYIKKGIDDTIFETISAGSISISDSLVTINPSNDFEYGTDYYVTIDSTTFMNNDSVYFSGISDKAFWNFRTFDRFVDINVGLLGVSYGSVKWGDYDNDGDLDILLSGKDNSSNAICEIYRNDGNDAYIDINAGLTGAYYGSSCWGDYDNDGDLDILLTGYYSEGVVHNYISKVYRNDGNDIFTDINAGLTGVFWSSVAWGDYDNDGDLDILLEGDTGSTYITKIYNNDFGDFTDIGAELPNVHRGSLAWGDYDNDGDLDILLSGEDDSSNAICEIYRNDSGIFTDIDAGLENVYLSSVAWGDYDNDGDIDILLSGYSSRRVSKIYRNDSGVFTDINAVLHEMANGSVAWGDYDNDGDLDALLTGEDNDGEWVRYSKLYSNNAGVFTEVNTKLQGVASSSIALGDYDNDGDLDIVLTGWTGSERISKIYRNDEIVANIVPSSPVNLSTSLTDSTVIFLWDKATDNETPQDGLSYNLYIGTVDNKDSVKSSMSDVSTGYRKVASIGNANQNNSWTINNLPSGEYYWSVQAIDHAFAGSEFSAEQILSLSDMISPQNVITEIIGSDIKLSWDESLGAISYKIYASNDPYGTFTDFTNFGTLNGLSWDLSWSGDKLFFYVIAVSGTKVITKSIKSNKTVIKSK